MTMQFKSDAGVPLYKKYYASIDVTAITLRPMAREYLFDSVCSRIVDLLECKKWRVPGIDVTFYEYRGERMVSTVLGPDFSLWFCREQRLLGNGWNDIAAVSEVRVGPVQVNVYDDGSGPSMQLYIGADLGADMEWWLTCSDVLPKTYGRPRRSLEYEGACVSTGGRYHNHANRYLVHTTDLGRAYSPEPLRDGRSPSVAWDWTPEPTPVEQRTEDAPRCVLASKVFEWVDAQLRDRLVHMEVAT